MVASTLATICFVFVESPDHTYVKLLDLLYDLFVFSKWVK